MKNTEIFNTEASFIFYVPEGDDFDTDRLKPGKHVISATKFRFFASNLKEKGWLDTIMSYEELYQRYVVNYYRYCIRTNRKIDYSEVNANHLAAISIVQDYFKELGFMDSLLSVEMAFAWLKQLYSSADSNTITQMYNCMSRTFRNGSTINYVRHGDGNLHILVTDKTIIDESEIYNKIKIGIKNGAQSDNEELSSWVDLLRDGGH